MMWWAHGFSWGWMIFGGLVMLLFWGGLIAVTVLAIRAFSGSAFRQSAIATDLSTPRPNAALEALKERYARGEITKAEYEDIRRDLMGS